MIRVPEAAFVFLSSGVTVGSSGIGITANGHVIRIPGHDSPGYHMVQLGMEMASLSETVHDAGLKFELQCDAARLVQVGRAVLEHSLKLLPAEVREQTA